MAGSPRVALCVATNREAETLAFLTKWAPFLGPEVSVYIHEDHPTKEFSLPAPANVALTHTCHADIGAALGKRAWIIPRRSGAGRSFPMYLAWKGGHDFIITLDDDCYPHGDEGKSYIDTHLGAFRMDRWFRTIDGEEPRGIPYGPKGELPVLLNHGLWSGVPDLDGPTALVRGRWPANVILRAAREVVPPGMWFPLCAMNVCYSRAAIPAAYNLLMGLDDAGFDRFDDIWSGLFLKRVADHLGMYVTSGVPFIHHTKASNYFSNLRKEALGIHLHESMWTHVANADLTGARTVGESYARLAKWIAKFPAQNPTAPSPRGYFEKLSEAMLAWTALFEEAPASPPKRRSAASKSR